MVTPLSFQLILERLSEVDHVGFGAAVRAIQQLGCECHNGRDVDEQAVVTRHESRQRRERETRQGRDIQVDHGLEIVDLCVQ